MYRPRAQKMGLEVTEFLSPSALKICKFAVVCFRVGDSYFMPELYSK